jgi:hypothetical protein
MQKEELPSFDDALNEYFKLKNTFETQINANKKKIINNPTLSDREKRSEYLKLMPKCVNCKRPSKKGTIFSSTYLPETDKTDKYRILKASCGDLADPCNLDIEIQLDKIEPIETVIDYMKSEIKDYKNLIINNKNKLLFGMITTENAVEYFEENIMYVNELTSSYEIYLDKYNEITDNQDKKLELDEALVQSYNLINDIKMCIVKMNENNDKQYAVDAARIYATTLKPLLDKIRHLKYSENMIFHDDDNNTCKLIQNKNSINQLNTEGFYNKVLKFDVGLKVKKVSKKKKALFIVESDESIENKENEEPQEKKELTIKIQEPGKPKPTGEIPHDEPIIGQGEDGIDWHLEEYKNLWKKLPPKLKSEFKLNIDWMKDFMYKCLNAKRVEGIKYNGCRLPTPSNLIIPPKETPNGQYDFGVSIYNTSFNKLPQSLQKTYLSFYKEDPTTKVKNYKMLEDAMNSLVEKEVDFGRGFF